MHSVMEQHSQLLVPDELEAPTCRKVTLKLHILKINRFLFCGPKFLHSGQGDRAMTYGPDISYRPESA